MNNFADTSLLCATLHARLAQPDTGATQKEAPFVVPDFAAQARAIWGDRKPNTAAERQAMEDFFNEGQQG